MRKTILDRPHSKGNEVFDRMLAELSQYMNELEVDRCVDFLFTIHNSKFDINYTVDDASTQLKIILGNERYEEIKQRWAKKNQHLLKDVGTKKYRHISTGLLYDGLDPKDNPNDYEVIYV